VWDVVQDKKTAQLGGFDELINPHIALSADGRWLAGVVDPDAISVWHTTSGKRFFVLRPERSSIMSIAWNRQADKLAVGLADGGISIWDIVQIRGELAKLKLDWTGECPGGQESGD
jgi:WD40 repeat protein